MNSKMLFCETFNLTSGDFDQHSRIKPYAIFNLFQEVALLHASLLKAGHNDLKFQNKAWILIRSKYVILKQPVESQKVQVQTWPLPGHKVEYNREFRILDSNNDILVKGTSKWVVIDLTTKTISRNNIQLNGNYFMESNFEDNLEKIPSVDLNADDLIYSYQVQLSDLDRYQHMNNAKYSEIILNSLSLNENQSIIEVQINFINEMKLYDVVQVFKTKVTGGYYIVGCKDDIVGFRAYVKIGQA